MRGQKRAQCFNLRRVFDRAYVLRIGPAFEWFQFGQLGGGPDQPEFFSPLFFVKDKPDVVIRNAHSLACGELSGTLIGGRRREQNVEARSLTFGWRTFVDDIQITALRADK